MKVCPICFEIFNNHKDLIKHGINNHMDKTCVKCELIFPSSTLLLQHIENISHKNLIEIDNLVETSIDVIEDMETDATVNNENKSTKNDVQSNSDTSSSEVLIISFVYIYNYNFIYFLLFISFYMYFFNFVLHFIIIESF